jgi:hypothetical protein
MLFAKVAKKAGDEAVTDLSMVEWLHEDDLDAKSDFFSSSIWEFPDEGDDGVLREECSHWRMFRELPDLDAKGEKKLKPGPGFDFWKFFKRLFRLHEGEVAALEDTKWVRREGWPPMDKSFWHCQYIPSYNSYQKAMYFGCRGSPKNKSLGKVNWGESRSLTAQEVLAIGTTSICDIDSTLATKMKQEDASSRRWSKKEDASSPHHWRRTGTMVSYMRFLVFLLNEKQWCISMYTVESIWKSMELICQAKQRFCKSNRNGKGGPKGKLSGKGKQ